MLFFSIGVMIEGRNREAGKCMKEKVTAIVVAAGSASRMEGIDKQWALIDGIPVLVHSLMAFERNDRIDEIIAVVRQSDQEKTENAARQYGIQKLNAVVAGGDSRQASVKQGILAANPQTAYYCIHDGARPLVSQATIDACLSLAEEKGACTAAVKVKDTIKVGGCDGSIDHTPDREQLYITQTPQVFAAQLYRDALQECEAAGLSMTDDCQLVERQGKKVYLAQGDYKNIKITTPEDIQIAAALLKEKGQPSYREERKAVRIGHGYDVHRLIEGRPLILGGVCIPGEWGLLGHSDADVLLHAVMDALLGALALGDIGKHFPDTDESYRGADSKKLLERVMALIEERGYRLENLDATVIAQWPKLSPHIPEMRRNIAALCHVDTEAVSVKATTEEGLGFTGAKEGIAAHAVCLLTKK